jgi:hypothetical protein
LLMPAAADKDNAAEPQYIKGYIVLLCASFTSFKFQNVTSNFQTLGSFLQRPITNDIVAAIEKSKARIWRREKHCTQYLNTASQTKKTSSPRSICTQRFINLKKWKQKRSLRSREARIVMTPRSTFSMKKIMIRDVFHPTRKKISRT